MAKLTTNNVMTKFVIFGFLLYGKKYSLKFHRFADDKFAKCKSACNYIFRNPSMTAYKIESRKSKLANI